MLEGQLHPSQGQSTPAKEYMRDSRDEEKESEESGMEFLLDKWDNSVLSNLESVSAD